MTIGDAILELRHKELSPFSGRYLSEALKSAADILEEYKVR